MPVNDILADYSKETTAHAIPQIFDKERKIWARLFWTIILLAGSSVFVFQVLTLVFKYIGYDKSVATSLEFQSLPFPAVSFCNYNPLKRDQIPNDSLASIYLNIYERFLQASNVSTIEEICSEERNKYEGGDTSDVIPITLACNGTMDDPVVNGFGRFANAFYLKFQAKAQKDVGLLMSLGMNDTYKDALYTISETILSCSYDMKTCNSTEFTLFQNLYFGNCFTFNTSSTVSKSGAIYGLRVLMDVKSDQYLLSSDVLGGKVVVHDSHVAAMPELEAISVAVGYRTSIGVVQVETHRLSAPYGNCVSEAVSIEQCLMKCQQSYVTEMCNCTLFGYGMTNMCWTPEQQKCGVQAQAEVAASSTMDMCNCVQSCQEISYKATVSHNTFPSKALAMARCAGNETCAEEFSSTTLEFEVYYEQLNYQMYEEQPSYELVNLFSDIGGSIGLWLGASVCTLIEFLTLFLSILFSCCCLMKNHIEKNDPRIPPAKVAVVEYRMGL